jgi:hypothetical protein
MTRGRILAAVSFAVLVLAGSGLVIEQTSRSHTVAVDPHGTVIPAQRRLQLSRLMPSPSSADGLHAKLVSGTMPTAPVQATVLTDEECQADARGISHCLNRLRLPNGSEIQVRHPHDMTLVPCLAPGEHVRLVPARAA